jgi:DHA1 family bicyclomycin/chloramphenicol resistance-like MFS transporter
MLAAGPLSDRYGRRPVLLGGLALYLAATAACALAGSVAAIVTARVFQALGGCAGTVIGRVIVRERFAAGQQAALLSRISTGMALSPVVAPLAGSVVAGACGWRGVFALLGVAGAVALALVWRHLPETHARPAAQASVVRTWRMLLGDRRFLRYALAISCAYCTYFPFIAASSTLFQRGLRVSGPVYAAIFGATVLGYVIGSNVFRRMGTRWPADRALAVAACVNLCGAAALWAATSAAPAGVAAIVLPMFVVMVSVGMAIPACQFAVLQPFAAIAGTASGLFFFVQMAFTAACGALLDRLADGSARPFVMLTVGASAGLALVCLCLRGYSAVRSANSSGNSTTSSILRR